MRSRNIKPGFFKNEHLAELSAADRLLFIGLWCLAADREGRLEDRPKRIKMELMPMDNYDVSSGLDGLEHGGFITRYVIEGQSIIEIGSFCKHQSPHGTEKDSELPDSNGMLTVHERGKNGQVTGQKRLINVKERESEVSKRPDSLNPDSLNPDSLNNKQRPAKPASGLSASDLVNMGVDAEVARDFLAIRKAKKAPLTATALKGIESEAAKASVTLSTALATCAVRGWQSFKADWYKPADQQQPQQQTGYKEYRPK
jgi:hypothetical protein